MTSAFIPISVIRLGTAEEELVLEVLRSGHLVQGPKVEQFENRTLKRGWFPSASVGWHLQPPDLRTVATQSSVSRDLEELGVIKHRGSYALPHTNGDSARGLLGLDTAGEVLVVAKCLPGRASSVAVEIDDAVIPEIVGTLAGEDTIFIAVRDQKAQRAAMKKIWELFG